MYIYNLKKILITIFHLIIKIFTLSILFFIFLHFNNKYKISERPTILLFFNQVDRVANNVILYSKQNIKKLSEGYYKLYSIINYNTDSIVSNIKDNEKDKVDNEVMPDSNIESTNQNTKNAIFLPNTIKKINFDEVIWCFNNKNNEWNLYLNNSLKESNSIDIIEYYNPFNGELESATYGFDSNGKMIIGWGIDKDNNYYYFDDDKVTYGIMSTGWKNIESKYYFFGTNGKLLVDSITPDGYYVDEDGVCININDLKKHLNRKKNIIGHNDYVNNNKITDIEKIKFIYLCHLMDNLDISKIYIPNTQEDGIIKYKNFIFFYDSDRKIINDVRDLVDISKFAIAINRTKKIVTIYGWDNYINNYSIPIVSFPCTTNKIKTELGIHFISDKYRWKDLYGGHFGQYAMRFAEHQLLHSVLYSSPDINALEIKSYNGINNDTQSSGCIRLRSGDAYWMYNHIDNGALVYVYDGVSTNPYGREVFEELDHSYTFDPTDPLVK